MRELCSAPQLIEFEKGKIFNPGSIVVQLTSGFLVSCGNLKGAKVARF